VGNASQMRTPCSLQAIRAAGQEVGCNASGSAKQLHVNKTFSPHCPSLTSQATGAAEADLGAATKAREALVAESKKRRAEGTLEAHTAGLVARSIAAQSHEVTAHLPLQKPRCHISHDTRRAAVQGVLQPAYWTVSVLVCCKLQQC
jgi:hypothetical protein